MTEILSEILKYMPDPKKISDSGFEGANIVLYTKDKDFFLDDKGCVREAVNAIILGNLESFMNCLATNTYA